MDAADVTREHNRRQQALDPWLAPWPDPAPGGDVFHAETDSGAALASVRPVDVDQGTATSLWSPPHTWPVALRIAGADPYRALMQVLDEAGAHVLAQPLRGDDAALVVRVASADAVVAKALARHGFSPATVTAITSVDASRVAGPSTNVLLRDAVAGDRALLVDWAVALHAFDAQFGAIGNPPERVRLLAEGIDEALASPHGHALVAELDGEPVGFGTLTPPQDCAWVGGITSLGPVAYLGQTFVRPDIRGGGTGAALAAALYATAVANGYGAIVLDHAALNSRSTAFWYRQGYRPLMTTWHRYLVA